MSAVEEIQTPAAAEIPEKTEGAVEATDDDMPALAGAGEGEENAEPKMTQEQMQALLEQFKAGNGGQLAAMQGESRAQKKVQKALTKFGLTEVSGVRKVSIKKDRDFFSVSGPKVYKSPNSETYVVYGVFQNAQQAAGDRQTEAAKGLQEDILNAAQGVPTEDAGAAAAADDSAKASVTEADLDEGDIDLVIAQADVDRAAAVKALLENGGDIVNSIMALTSA